MARTQETRKYATEDGEVEIMVQKMGGMAASKLGLKLGGLLGPGIIGLCLAGEGGTNAAQAGADAGKMLFEKLTPPVFEAVLKEMLDGAQMTKDGEFHDVTLALLDDTFSGVPASIFKLALDLIRMNFRNFLKGFGLSSATETKLDEILAKQAKKAGF